MAENVDAIGLVLPGFACPSCGERGLERLAWLKPDCELVCCATSGAEYAPAMDRRACLTQAVVRIGEDIGGCDQSFVADWRELAGTLTDEQLDRWYRVSACAAKAKKEAGKTDKTAREGQ